MIEIDPKETNRAYAFEFWMKAPMPMVTFFKTLDVSRLVKISKRDNEVSSCDVPFSDNLQLFNEDYPKLTVR